MSTSSRSKHRSPLHLAKRHRVVGIAAGIVVALMVVWVSAARPHFPELRVVETGGTLSVQIVDKRHVVLIANTSSPTRARAALGTLNRPWEPQPNVVVADSRDAVAGGLWETLRRSSPEQLIILGAPGDSREWAQIERFCREHNVEIRYLDQPVVLKLDTLSLILAPGPNTSRGFPDSHAIVSSGSVRLAIELGGLPPSGRFHVVVAGDTLSPGLGADLEIVSNEHPASSRVTRRLVVEQGRRVVLVIEPDRIRVRGGSLASVSEN